MAIKVIIFFLKHGFVKIKKKQQQQPENTPADESNTTAKISQNCHILPSPTRKIYGTP